MAGLPEKKKHLQILKETWGNMRINHDNESLDFRGSPFLDNPMIPMWYGSKFKTQVWAWGTFGKNHPVLGFPLITDAQICFRYF